jgi:putative ABC transport system permease protein
MSTARTIDPADLEELSIHLRDEWEAAVAKGLEPEEAFNQARGGVGDYAAIESAYRQVEVRKMLAGGALGSEVWNRVGMAGCYLTSAWRNLHRHPGYAALNIAGLSLALASALVVGLFISHSLSYDRFHEDVERIYRVVQDRGHQGPEGGSSRPARGLADLIRDNWVDAELVSESTGNYATETQLTVEGAHSKMAGLNMVDAQFLDLFSFPLKASLTQKPLDAPDTLILTESAAERLFGLVNPLGQTVRLDATRDLTVTGIAFDAPTNTHLPFSALIRSFDSHQEIVWNRMGARTYVRLRAGASPKDLEEYLNARIAEAQPGAVSSFRLQPVTDIYLNSGRNDDYATVSDVRYLYLFGSIGILILALACINYMNLATARAAQRCREVGVRKVVGATSSQVRRQFLTESLVLTMLAVPVAVVLVPLVLPVINSISGGELEVSLLVNPGIWLAVAILIMLVALGAGLYPALLMAKPNPVTVFSGGRNPSGGRHTVRRVLVGIQVAMSFTMIVATMVVSTQIDYIQNQNLGFGQDQVVTIQTRGWTGDQFERFKSEINASPSVQSTALGPALGVNTRFMTWGRTLEDSGQEVQLEAVRVGRDYLETMGLTVVEGRSFRPEDLDLEPTPVVVTESYVRVFGRGESVVGSISDLDSAGPIVGVIEDFQNASFTRTSSFTVLQMDESYTGLAVVKLAGGATVAGLEVMKSAWDRISPERPFVYEFLDERIQSQYTAEMRLAELFRVFAGLSILIASLGLFGLASFTTRQRIKEIGIRKSLGATVSGLVLLLSREFVYVVGVAILCMTPLISALGARWLGNFSQHINIGVTLFVQAGLVAMLFVLFAVGLQTVRAALANPTNALRHD